MSRSVIAYDKAMVWSHFHRKMVPKDNAIRSYCRRVSEQTSEQWRYIRINQKDVNLVRSVSLLDLFDGLQRQALNIFKVEE